MIPKKYLPANAFDKIERECEAFNEEWFAIMERDFMQLPTEKIDSIMQEQDAINENGIVEKVYDSFNLQNYLWDNPYTHNSESGFCGLEKANKIIELLVSPISICATITEKVQAIEYAKKNNYRYYRKFSIKVPKPGL